ncbi:MAG: hypothetical protein U5K00_05055 [Melioribacteraceae bacterium]|nr:hypothetical protein [Melioribacteraceae bacterium]
MYSPNIQGGEVYPHAYRLKLAVGKPMTVLVSEAVEQYLNKHQSLIKEVQNECQTSN